MRSFHKILVKLNLNLYPGPVQTTPDMLVIKHDYRINGIGKIITENDIEIYFKRNKLHREDGPAVVYPHTYGHKEYYWINGINLTKKEYFKVLHVAAETEEEKIKIQAMQAINEMQEDK